MSGHYTPNKKSSKKSAWQKEEIKTDNNRRNLNNDPRYAPKRKYKVRIARKLKF